MPIIMFPMLHFTRSFNDIAIKNELCDIESKKYSLILHFNFFIKIDIKKIMFDLKEQLINNN